MTHCKEKVGKDNDKMDADTVCSNAEYIAHNIEMKATGMREYCHEVGAFSMATIDLLFLAEDIPSCKTLVAMWNIKGDEAAEACKLAFRIFHPLT